MKIKNVTVRGSVTCRRLDSGNSSVFVHSRAKMQTNPAGNSRRTRCFCIGFFFGSNRLTLQDHKQGPGGDEDASENGAEGELLMEQHCGQDNGDHDAELIDRSDL